MSPRLPPLNAVRAFVAAARHESFTLAAAELHVTHGAISRQIKHLETYLGVDLFVRQVRQIRLTPEGQQFQAQASQALDQLAAAAHALQARPPAPTVTLNVRPSFAVGWLIPRLPTFVAQHPGIEPRVMTSTVAPDAAAEPFDIGLRRGLTGWPPNTELVPFLEDELITVAAPALYGAHTWDTPAALAAHVLLSARTRSTDWNDWARQLGLGRLKAAGRLQFDHLHFVLQGARDGLGVALAPYTLVSRDLAQGRLCSPWPHLRTPLPRYYYGIAPDASASARAFAAWLDTQSLEAVPTQTPPDASTTSR